MKKCIFIFACLLVLANTARAQTWQFKVLLDNKPIGQHTFSLRENNDNRILTSQANFNVKFLFINAYQYQHSATETWNGDCLNNLEAKTIENDKTTIINGTAENNRFLLNQGKQTLPACVMTFAYWNPKILTQNKLLNPQTGDYLDSKIKNLGKETISVQGQEKQAERYQISTSKFNIDLWYGANGEWLGLTSTTPEGRKIQYVLQ